MKKLILGLVAGALLAGAYDLYSAATYRNESVIWNFVNGVQVAGVSISDDGITQLANSTTISDAEGEGSITLGRPTSGAITVLTADDDADADLTIKAGGTGAMTLGAAGNTAVTVTTDGGSIVLDGTIAFPNAETISNATNGAFILGRNDSGTVTVTAADDDSTAALTILPGGAAAMTLGGASMTSLTVTADGAQDADVVLPANSIGGAEVSGMRLDLVFCGQADENGTIYLSPTAGVNGVDFGDGVDYSISGTACDALDGATETTQDLVIFPEVAFKVMGMYCQQAGAEALGAGETMVFTLRAGAADLTPTITCTISEAQRGCRSLTGTTTNVAANAAVAMKLVQSSNNTDQDAWCQVSIMLQ